MRRTVAIAAVVSAAGLGCESSPDSLPVARLAHLAAADEHGDAELAKRRARLDYLRHTLRLRLQTDFDPPKEAKRAACDEALLSGGTAAQQTVLLRVNDARVDGRMLLPLRLTGPVEHDPDVPRKLGPLPSPPDSIAVADRLIRRLEGALERRYAAVVHITHYTVPKWIRKPNRRRAEWVPGWVRAWVAVHDVRSGSMLCQTLLDIRNDVSDVSIRVRLRSDTRHALVKALGETLRSETERALQNLGGALLLPGERRRPGPS